MRVWHLANPRLAALVVLASGTGPSASAQPPVDLQGTYTGDYFAVLSGGAQRGSDYLADVSVVLRMDGEAVFGWRGSSFLVYGLANYGDRPSERIGDVQGASNIEAPSTVKLFEAWWQQNLLSERVSLLVGLYDLNSEFDVIEAGGLFLNSSFGIGAELGASGANGPSTFPTTSLGLRLSAHLSAGLLVRTAVLDGVPGDPSDPYGTHISLSGEDGALAALELVSLDRWDTSEAGATRRRISRGHERAPYRRKLALGAWLYTTDLPRLTPGSSESRRGTFGLYLLGEQQILPAGSNPEHGLTAFARLGWADPGVNPLTAHVGAGVVYDGLWGSDRLGLGVTAAFSGDDYRAAAAAEGRDVDTAEIALEVTYRAQLTDRLSLQPDLQYVINPGLDPALADAVVVALRLELSN